MKLKIFDAIQRETTAFASNVYLSKDGKRAFAVYQITATETSKLAAELFDTSSGKLVTLATYISDLQYVSVESGAASPDFTKFSIVEAKEDENLYRVRILSYDGISGVFDVVTGKIYEGIAKGFTSYGGTFLSDGSAVIHTAVQLQEGNVQKSVLIVSSSSDLFPIVAYAYEGIYPVIASSFAIGNVNYFAICSSKGILDFNDVTAFWKPEHRLEVFRIDDINGLVLVTSALLPQGAMTVSVHHHCGEVKISVGTTTALPPGEKTIPIHTTTNQSATANEHEYRVYDFIDEKLYLTESIDTDSTVECIYRTNAGYTLVAQNTLAYEYFGQSMLQIRHENNFNLAIPINGFVTASSDECGKNLIIGSALQADTPSYSNNNIILVKIVKKCK